MISLINQQYAAVRGFNYQPSYAPTGYSIWSKLKLDVIEREIGLGKKDFPKINTLRLWLPFDAFAMNPTQFINDFESFLQILDRFQLKAIPTLFNNWHSIPDFGGISEEIIRTFWRDIHHRGSDPDYPFRAYLERIVGDHASDNRILAWDLCNEPENNGDQKLIFEWLQHTYSLCKTLHANQPIGVSIQADPKHMKDFNPISDVFLIHPYFASKKEWEKILAVANKYGKGIIATECIWGALDDGKRAEIVRSDLEVLSRHHIGFLPHMLHESLVADGHRPQFGPICKAVEYMAFINMDGTIRKGHESFNDY